jgi:hypothetical protein
MSDFPSGMNIDQSTHYTPPQPLTPQETLDDISISPSVTSTYQQNQFQQHFAQFQQQQQQQPQQELPLSPLMSLESMNQFGNHHQ